jgi:hypothetical protein
MFYSSNALGSLILDINGSRVDAKFLRETGTIGDYFTLLKTGGPEPLKVVMFKHRDGRTELRWTSATGGIYQVQQTARLESPQWTALQPEVVALGPATSWISSDSDETMFYRVVRVN